MKPFDLEEYKKNPSRELVTRDGHKARLICTDREGDIYPIVALIQIDSKEIIQTYTEFGYVIFGDTHSSDLFFASVKHKGWINVCATNTSYYSGQAIYDTEEEARLLNPSSPVVATIPIEWEE